MSIDRSEPVCESWEFFQMATNCMDGQCLNLCQQIGSMTVKYTVQSFSLQTLLANKERRIQVSENIKPMTVQNMVTTLIENQEPLVASVKWVKLVWSGHVIRHNTVEKRYLGGRSQWPEKDLAYEHEGVGRMLCARPAHYHPRQTQQQALSAAVYPCSPQ